MVYLKKSNSSWLLLWIKRNFCPLKSLPNKFPKCLHKIDNVSNTEQYWVTPPQPLGHALIVHRWMVTSSPPDGVGVAVSWKMTVSERMSKRHHSKQYEWSFHKLNKSSLYLLTWVKPEVFPPDKCPWGPAVIQTVEAKIYEIFMKKAKHVNTNIMVWYNMHDTCSNYKWYTQRKWHHQTYTGRYLSTKHQLRRQVFKNILAMHRKQMQFHKHQIGRWNGRFKTRVLWVEEGGVLW